MKKVAIIIPNYRKKLTRDEKISVKHLNKYLNNYDKFLVLPESIPNVSLNLSRLKIEHFPSYFFQSLGKYSELMNSEEFYERFNKYEYILIYQLDALVFSDKLKDWCGRGFDYIGAPLFESIIGRLTHKLGEKFTGGNGGLSLRKVSSFIKVIQITKESAKRQSVGPMIHKFWFLKALLERKTHGQWLDAPAKDYPFNEDGFWSFEAIKYSSSFKVAPFNEALKFSIERYPRKCFELNHKQMPFGCHAWAKYERSFWEKYLIK